MLVMTLISCSRQLAIIYSPKFSKTRVWVLVFCTHRFPRNCHRIVLVSGSCSSVLKSVLNVTMKSGWRVMKFCAEGPLAQEARRTFRASGLAGVLVWADSLRWLKAAVIWEAVSLKEIWFYSLKIT